MSATSPAVSAGFRKWDCAMPFRESLMRLALQTPFMSARYTRRRTRLSMKPARPVVHLRIGPRLEMFWLGDRNCPPFAWSASAGFLDSPTQGTCQACVARGRRELLAAAPTPLLRQSPLESFNTRIVLAHAAPYRTPGEGAIVDASTGTTRFRRCAASLPSDLVQAFCVIAGPHLQKDAPLAIVCGRDCSGPWTTSQRPRRRVRLGLSSAKISPIREARARRWLFSQGEHELGRAGVLDSTERACEASGTRSTRTAFNAAKIKTLAQQALG